MLSLGYSGWVFICIIENFLGYRCIILSLFMFLWIYLGELDFKFKILCVCSDLENVGCFCDMGLSCVKNEFVWRGLNKGIIIFDNIFLLMLMVF